VIGYLFDTCTISHWYNKHPLVEKQAESIVGEQLFVSAISIGEIACGHAKKNATDVAKQAAFRKWIKETFEDNLLTLDLDTAENYGRYRALLFEKFGGKNKRPEQCVDATGHSLGIDENDLWLVSQAYAHRLHFVTTDQMSRIRAVCGNEVDIIVWPLI